MKKKPTVWLARDGYGGKKKAVYNLAIGHKMFYDPKERWWTSEHRDEIYFAPEQFERIAPKSCHLPPGHKPIEIDITIERRK